MKHILIRSIAAVAVLATSAFAETPMPALKVDDQPLKRNEHNSFAPVIEKVASSVVTISIKAKQSNVGNRRMDGWDEDFLRRFFGIPGETPQPKLDERRAQRLVPAGLGSGVVVSPDGFILTNHHVVEIADEITVTLADGKTEFRAKKIASDAGTDIALIKVEAQNLTPIIFADSDKIKVGDVVFAIGSPFALRQTVTKGIVSALGRKERAISDFANFIQTDASINPGNSGGALADTEGRLVGIPSAIYSRTGGNMGIGFAVPANQARSVMESLVKFGRVQRGFLGIGMDEVNEKLAKNLGLSSNHGIIVTNVLGDGAAAKAGIRVEDVIVQLAGRKVESMVEFRDTVANMLPGAKIDLKVVRDGKEMDITVTLGDRPVQGVAAVPAPEKAPDVLDGVTVADVSDVARKQFGIEADVTGALITRVDPNSPSADAEIRPGDVVVSIDGKDIKSADDAVKISEEVKTKNSVRLRVHRGGQTRFVVVEEAKK